MSGKNYFSLVGFSGGLICDDELPDITTKYQGAELIIFRPRRISRANHSGTPQINEQAFCRFTGNSETETGREIAIIPILAEDNLYFYATENEYDDKAENFVDCFPVQILNFQEGYDIIALSLINEVIDRLRIKTNQYWAGSSYLPSVLMLGKTDITETGELGPFWKSSAPFYISNTDIKGVNKDTLVGSIEESIKGLPINQADNALSKFWSALAQGDLFQALIYACVSIEIRRNIIADILDVRINGTDLLRHLRNGFDAVSHQNFETYNPEAFSAIKRMWIARGHVAHGKQPILIDKNCNPGVLTILDMRRDAKYVLETHEWLKSLVLKSH